MRRSVYSEPFSLWPTGRSPCPLTLALFQGPFPGLVAEDKQHRRGVGTGQREGLLPSWWPSRWPARQQYFYKERGLGQILEGNCVSEVINESNKWYPSWTLSFLSKKSRFLRRTTLKQRMACIWKRPLKGHNRKFLEWGVPWDEEAELRWPRAIPACFSAVYPHHTAIPWASIFCEVTEHLPMWAVWNPSVPPPSRLTGTC